MTRVVGTRMLAPGGSLPHPLMQRHVAFSAVAPTTLRNMLEGFGHRGRICEWIGGLDLGRLGSNGVAATLDEWTGELERRIGAWGPARKAINLFLRDAAYNHWLRTEYRLGLVEGEFELPLDGLVAERVRTWRADGVGAELPRIATIKRLTPRVHAAYQAAAAEWARELNLARVHLDIRLWNGGSAGRG